MTWPTVQLRRIARLEYGDSLPGRSRIEGSIAVFGSNGQVGTHHQANTSSPVIVIGRKGSYGAINWSSEPVFAIDTTFFVDPSSTAFEMRWLYYTMLSARLDGYTRDTAVPGLSRESAYEARVTLPPPEYRIAIADFLDDETDRLDQLMSMKRRLIELLEEKRTALISHAVTKGLDPTVPMKDSGVPWLGEIPANWRIVPLKHAARLNERTLPEGMKSDFEIQYVDISSVSSDGSVTEPQVLVFADSPTRARRVVRSGDTIISTVRTYLGAVAFFDDPAPNLVCSTGFAVLSPSRVEARFLRFWAMSEGFIEAVSAYSTGVSYPAISPGTLGSLPILLPPQDEQRRISSELEETTKKAQGAVELLHKQLGKLSEYRHSLITAAVTGQIDVTTEPVDPEEATA